MKNVYVEVSRCRICGSEDLSPVLSLGRQCLTGIFPRSPEEAVASGPLDLVRCAAPSGAGCGLVQLRQTYDKAEMYGSRYGYRSGLNESMVRHLRETARRILARVPLRRGDLVLDIGSNDGTLLSAFPQDGPTLVGMDPTGKNFRSYYPAAARLIPEFFSAQRFGAEFPGVKAKVVASVAMFYDLDDPSGFAAEVSGILAADGVWLFEQSYLPAMIENNAYDTVCHEHLEYYALKQVLWVTEKAGLKVVDLEFNDVNGGSFAVMAAHRDSPLPECGAALRTALAAEAKYDGPGPFRDFRDKVLRHRDELRAFLARVRGEGRSIAGYGASTKGNVILQFCGITPKDLPKIGEVNSEKFGCYTPGTLIPIVPEEAVKAEKPDYLFVLPWHFKDFIMKKEAGYLGAGGRMFFPLPVPHVP